MKLTDHSYGKARVRVLKVLRDGAKHSLKEIDVQVMLHGDFDASYTKADNSLVVATDSMKNFVHRMGLEYGGETLEGFVELVGGRLLARYDHIEGVQVSARQVPF